MSEATFLPNHFVMEGSHQGELFMIMTIVCLSLLLRNITIPWIFLGKKFYATNSSYWFKFSLDFGFLVLPSLLSVTLFSSSLVFIIICLIVCLVTMLVFVFCEYLMSLDRVPWRTVMNKIVDEHYGPTTFITYFRGMMLILVSIAILAVDFPLFPERFHKTEHYGHSLMDIGVSAFVVSASMSSRLKTSSMIEGKELRQKSKWWWLKSSYFVLPLIGLTRTVVVSFLGYHQPVTEYGVHWNFFYTIAILRIVSKLFPSKYPLVFAIIFGVLHQFILVRGLEEFILFDENKREDFFYANIEGIGSLLGYITLHFASRVVADFIAGTGIRVKSWLECCLRLFSIAGFFLCLQAFSEWTFGLPSRRVTNITYILSQLSLLIFSLASCLVVQMFSMVTWAANAPHFSTDDNPFCGILPCLCDSVNKNGLIFFLLANLLTGAVNIVLDTKSINDTTAFLILFSYILLLCIVVQYRSFVPKKNN
ncbi:unnamed protein product [Auanema sp. JU1783]|nr:unnamed protein product [Auanema sp. JU1783]